MALFLCRRHIGRRYRLLTAVPLSRNIEPLLPDGYSDSLEMQYSAENLGYQAHINEYAEGKDRPCFA